MSIESMVLALHHSKASGTDLLVLIGICNHDGDGGAWPSIATLAKYARVSERTVQRSLKALEGFGEVVVHLRKGGKVDSDPRYRTNFYDVQLDCPPSCMGGKNHRPRGDTRVGADAPAVTSDAASGDTRDEPAVTDVSPKPSCEPPEEPSTDSGDADASTGVVDPVLAHKCPESTCAAIAGSACMPGGRGARDAKGRHVKRVAHAVTKRWYDHQLARQGTAPLSPPFMAMRCLVVKAVQAGHDANAVYSIITALYEGAQPINAGTIDAALTNRQRASMVRGRHAGIANDQDVAWVHDQMYGDRALTEGRAS